MGEEELEEAEDAEAWQCSACSTATAELWRQDGTDSWFCAACWETEDTAQSSGPTDEPAAKRQRVEVACAAEEVAEAEEEEENREHTEADDADLNDSVDKQLPEGKRRKIGEAGEVDGECGVTV